MEHASTACVASLSLQGLCLGIGTFFESLSLRTGFPFGHYEFTDLMGPKISGLPILLALAYAGMGYLSWIVGAALLGGATRPLSGRKAVLLPLVASFVVTAWDLSMEAVWADIDHGWIWRDGGSYYGVPISNFFGGSSPHISSINSSRSISEAARSSRRAQVTGSWRLRSTLYLRCGIFSSSLPRLWEASLWMLPANAG